MSKPEYDFVKGLPPAIAIEQRVISRNPRSTVGTSTEIYEYLRLLFARIGKTFSPISGQEVKRHSTEDIIACTHQFAEGTRFLILAPVHVAENRTLAQQLEMYRQGGYQRLYVNKEVQRLDDLLASTEPLPDAKDIYIVVDLRIGIHTVQLVLRVLHKIRGRRHNLRRAQ